MASRAHDSRGPRCRRIQAARCCSRPECAQDQRGPRRPVGDADGVPRPAPSVRPVRPGRSFLPTGCGSGRRKGGLLFADGSPASLAPASSRRRSPVPIVTVGIIQTSPPSPCASRCRRERPERTLGDLPTSEGAPGLTVPQRAFDGELAPEADMGQSRRVGPPGSTKASNRRATASRRSAAGVRSNPPGNFRSVESFSNSSDRARAVEAGSRASVELRESTRVSRGCDRRRHMNLRGIRPRVIGNADCLVRAG
jgi:hypothetical protein